MCPEAPGLPVEAALAPLLDRLPRSAPLVILIHGYRYSPARAADDPNRLMFALHPARPGRKFVSWPARLGFRARGLADGLCLGFAWPAAPVDQGGPWAGRFARAYAAAGRAGTALARLLETIDRLSPGRAVDLIGHSLGARVALSAAAGMEGGRLGQVILLGGAEWDGRAVDALSAPGAAGARVYNVTSRENDLYDWLFTRFGPPAPPGQRPLSHGLGRHLACAVDLALDRPETGVLVGRRGVSLSPGLRRVCHWGFYTRPGALETYAAILRERHNWTVPALKAEAGAIAPAPRWSLLLPRPRWGPPDAGGAPGAAQGA